MATRSQTNQGKTKEKYGNEVDYLKNYLNNQDMQSLYDHFEHVRCRLRTAGWRLEILQSGDQNALEKV